MSATDVGVMYPVDITVDNDGSGGLKYLAVVQIEDGFAPGAFGESEEEAIANLRERVQWFREWKASCVPVPDGYPHTVIVEL